MTERSQIRQHRARGRGRKAFWILAAVGLAVALVAAARVPRGDHRQAPHRAGAHGELTSERIRELLADDSRWLDRLGIDEEQRPRIVALLEEAAPRFEAIAAEHDELREELMQAFSQPTADPEQLEELRWKTAEVAVRALDEGFDAAVELADVLTPEQRRELVERWRERR